MMDINRNQLFLAGLVVLFLGIQFRTIESVVLTPEVTQFLAERTNHPVAAVNSVAPTAVDAARPMIKKTVKPPDFLGWMLLSIGSVLILHSWGMKKPE